MSEEREVFEKAYPVPEGTYYNKAQDQYDTCDEWSELCDEGYSQKWRLWQAAQSSQAERVKELEDALRPFANFACGCGKCFNCIAEKALNQKGGEQS